MPLALPSAKVLVTGANGYLAMWIVRTLLDRGYSVRGTVRSASKGAPLVKYFKDYDDRFEVAVVTDFTEDGAFDECLVGVDAVIHSASPLPNPELGDLQEDYIKLTVGGITGIMKSARMFPNLKRIIYTSTTATVLRIVTEPTMITENDWNEFVVKMCEELGDNAPSGLKYAASKVLAEKAAIEMYEKEKATLPYDFVVLIPPWIFGPGINVTSNQSYSIRTWHTNVMANDEPRSDEMLSETTEYIDVRDLADIHVCICAGLLFVLETHHHGNNGSPTLQTLLLPKGNPTIQPNRLIKLDTTKAERVFGRSQFRSVEDTARDMMMQTLEN